MGKIYRSDRKPANDRGQSMAQNGKGDTSPAISTREIKDQHSSETAGDPFAWPNAVGVTPDFDLRSKQNQMTPNDLNAFGRGGVDNGVLQFEEPKYNLLEKTYESNGCTYVSGEQAVRLKAQHEQMALDDLSKPIGARQPANSDEQKDADEVAKLALRNAQGVNDDVVNGNERMRDIFRDMSPDAAQNVIDTANRAVQKDGYRFVRSENGQIRLATPSADGLEPDIHIKEPDCNQS